MWFEHPVVSGNCTEYFESKLNMNALYYRETIFYDDVRSGL